MSMDEITAVSEAYGAANKETWEQVRTLSYYTVVAQQGTEKYNKPSDLFPLPGEESNRVVAPRLTEKEFLQIAKQIRHG